MSHKLEVAGSHNWPNYIGPKKEKGQVCLTRQCLHPFLSRWRGLESTLLENTCIWNRDSAKASLLTRGQHCL